MSKNKLKTVEKTNAIKTVSRSVNLKSVDADLNSKFTSVEARTFGDSKSPEINAVSVADKRLLKQLKAAENKLDARKKNIESYKDRIKDIDREISDLTKNANNLKALEQPSKIAKIDTEMGSPPLVLSQRFRSNFATGETVVKRTHNAERIEKFDKKVEKLNAQRSYYAAQISAEKKEVSNLEKLEKLESKGKIANRSQRSGRIALWWNSRRLASRNVTTTDGLSREIKNRNISQKVISAKPLPSAAFVKSKDTTVSQRIQDIPINSKDVAVSKSVQAIPIISKDVAVSTGVQTTSKNYSIQKTSSANLKAKALSDVPFVKSSQQKSAIETNEVETQFNGSSSFLETGESAADSSSIDKKIEELKEERNFYSDKISDEKKEIGSLENKIDDLNRSVKKLEVKKGHLKSKLMRVGKTVNRAGGAAVGATVGAAVGLVKSGAKSGLTKLDPFAKDIDKNDIADTGTESVRFARKGIKTSKSTIKTTKRVLKKARKTVTTAARFTRKTISFAVKTVNVTVKIAVALVTHIIAALFNPLTWIIVGFLVLSMVISQLVMMLMGANSAAGREMSTRASGLDNLSSQYAQGLALFNSALNSHKMGFEALVDGIYVGARSRTDVVYFEISRNTGDIERFPRTLATPPLKEGYKSMWNFPLTANEILAIAYVKLQKDANIEGGTDGFVYSVSYTWEVLTEVIENSAAYSSESSPEHLCPEINCTTNLNGSTTCGANHNLRAIGLWFFQMETVMNALRFTDFEKQWVRNTIWGFENNQELVALAT